MVSRVDTNKKRIKRHKRVREKIFGTAQVGGQADLGRQIGVATPWLTERHGYDPT